MSESYQRLGTPGSVAGISSTSIKFSSLLVFVASTAGEVIVNKKINLAAAFPAAIGVLIAVVGLVAYPLICGVALGLGWQKRINMAVPWHVPAIIGAFFSLHHMLLNVGAVPVPGVIILVLMKFVVPASMLLNMSSRTFGLRYRWSHWLSLATLVVGMLIISYPALHNSGEAVSSFGVLRGSVLILISTLPLAGAFTYIELTLVKYHPNLFTVALWMYVCVFMVLFSHILAVPTRWLSSGVMRVSKPGTLAEGISCYAFGENPTGNSTLAHIPDCEEASKLWYISIILTLFANLAMPLVTKYAGATLMWFVKGFTVPLVGILFSMQCIMGDAASQLNMETVWGLAVVTIGVMGFNYEDPMKKEPTWPLTQAGNRVSASP